MDTTWTCKLCGFASTDPDINFPTVCPGCKAIYSQPDQVFDLGIRNNDTENKVEAAQRWQAERKERQRALALEAIKQGRKAWRVLHMFPMRWLCRAPGERPEWSPQEAERLLEQFEALIPEGYCKCKESYATYKYEDPPDFSSPEAFWEWGFRIHNRVNAKLAYQGKEQLSIDAALAEWKACWESLPVVQLGKT